MNNIPKKPTLAFKDFIFSAPEDLPKATEPSCATAVSYNAEAARAVLDSDPNYVRNEYLSNTKYGKSLLKQPKFTKLTPNTAVELLAYPHVLKRFQIIWGDPKGLHFVVESLGIMEMNRLWAPQDKYQSRLGFSPEVIDEIYELMESHDALFWLPEHLNENPSQSRDPYGITGAK